MWRSDEELMLSCRDGDEGAFEILYRRYEKPVLSFIYRMVTSATDAEDLCQETFLRVIRAKRRYKAKGKFKTWLFRIALNICRDRIRRMKFRSNLSLDVPMFSQDCEDAKIGQAVADLSSDPAKHAETDEMRRLVQQAFTKLTEAQRTVVVLREYAVYRNKGQAGGAILTWRGDALSYVLVGNAEMSQLMDMAQSISAAK